MPSNISIRPARGDADLQAAARLFRAYAASLDISLAYQGFEAELAALPGLYAPPAGELLLARDTAGMPVGCVALRPIGSPGCCEMKRLYVVPERRGVHLGHALVDAIIKVAERAGYEEMRLDTLPTLLGALSAYRRAGFRPIPPYNETPVAGTLFMGRSLRPVRG